ncbi:MAG: sodium/proline symporter [Woeseiaceae bacterium]|nr:sodium/proline symporter [Woeseiaceae bacterium]
MSGTVIFFLVLYYVVVLGIGYWALRRGGSEDLEGFLLGGRQVGPIATALTLQSTSMSGYMFLGAGGLGFSQGYWALWYAAGDIGGGVLSMSVIGRRMRKFSQMMGALTSIEYLEKRYPSPAVRLVSGSITIFLLGFYVLAQLIAGGKGMALVTGISYPIALAIAVGIILAYTFMGGYLAVAYTDFFQSLVMLVGVMWIVIAALSEVGGLTAANVALSELDPTLLSVWGKGLGFEGKWGIVAGAILIFSLGYMGWPHVVTRHMAMSRPGTARKAGFWATVWSTFFVPSPYLVGILAILILPGLDDPEMAIFQVAEQLLPAAVTGLVMAAIMAAIMSTADSLLLQTGSIASRDIYERFINPEASERQMVMVSRGLIVAIAAIGYIVALVEPPTVFSIVVFATSVLGSAFVPAYICAVWWKKANTAGALASMIVGATVAFVWEYAGLVEPTEMHPMFAGIVASTITMIVVSLATQKISPVSAHVLDAMDVCARIGPIPERFDESQFSIVNEAAAVDKALEEERRDE